MINDTHLGNEYQEVANVLKRCNQLKTWTIYCRSGDEDDDNESAINTSFSSISTSEREEGEDNDNNNNSSDEGENRHHYPPENEKVKQGEFCEIGKENTKLPLTPLALQKQFRKTFEEEMDYGQVSNYLDRGIYNDVNEQSGTVMLLSEMINSSSTYNINHNLQSKSGK